MVWISPKNERDKIVKKSENGRPKKLEHWIPRNNGSKRLAKDCKDRKKITQRMWGTVGVHNTQVYRKKHTHTHTGVDREKTHTKCKQILV